MHVLAHIECELNVAHHNYVNMVSLFFCNLQVIIIKTWRFYLFIIIIFFYMEERHHLHRVYTPCTQSPPKEMHSNREYKIYKEMHITGSESTQPLQQ